MPLCVNPDHLFLGDAAINMDDASAKARLGRKLNPELVRQIRQEFAPGDGPAQAARMGISHSTLYAVVNRRIWKHVA